MAQQTMKDVRLQIVQPDDKPEEKNNGMPDEKEVVTRHTTRVNGQDMTYSAVVGNIWVNTKKVKPAASFFHVDFLKLDKQGRTDPTRPVTFVFNGGPGSSTTFLLMGSFGPKRVDTGDVVQGMPAPYRLVENDESLLPISDLIFVDAPGAGSSKVADKAKKEIWSVDGDVAAFSQFIRRWLSKNRRWNSPKYLFGESYGTVRGAALSYRLLNDGTALSGMTLISNILDYAHTFTGDDQLYIGFFPTFATSAWYQGRAGKGLTLAQQARKARAFAGGPYRQALAQGDRLSETDFDAVASQYAHLTGLSVDYVRQSNLRIPVERFSKELLRNTGKILGAYDGRVAGYDLDRARDQETFLIDDAYLDPAYTATVEGYLRDELGYKSHDLRKDFADVDLEVGEPGKAWQWKHKLPDSSRIKETDWQSIPFPRVIDDLASAITHEPGLKVMIGNGLFDLCTPFFQTEFDIDHLELPKALRKNVALTYYPSGHMIYTAPKALPKLVADLGKLYAAPAGDVSSIDEREPLPSLHL